MRKKSTLILLPVKSKNIIQTRQRQRQIYELIAADMYAICLQYTSNKHQAEKLFEQGFIELFNRFDTYDDQQIPLKEWGSKIFHEVAAVMLYRMQYNKKEVPVYH